MHERSTLPEVRNPLLSLPSARKILTLPTETRLILYGLLRELAAETRIRAQDSWKRNKGPMALYWKTLSVYAGHIARLVKVGKVALMTDHTHVASLVEHWPLGSHVSIEHDGFEGTIVGYYERRDRKRGVVLQQVGTRVIHVYGEKWLQPAADRGDRHG